MNGRREVMGKLHRGETDDGERGGGFQSDVKKDWGGGCVEREGRAGRRGNVRKEKECRKDGMESRKATTPPSLLYFTFPSYPSSPLLPTSSDSSPPPRNKRPGILTSFHTSSPAGDWDARRNPS